MTAFSPVPAYVIGIASVGLGIHCVLAPKNEYPRFGLPLEAASGQSASGAVSPFIYLKGIREASYGFTLIALQYLGFDEAVTTFVGVLAFVALGDSVVVWSYGGPKLRRKALGHLGAGIGLAAWAGWRLTRG